MCGNFSAWRSMPTRASTPRASRRASAGARCFSPNATLSTIERCGKSAKSWNISPTCRFSGGTNRSGPATSWPLIRTRPRDGFSIPEAMRNSVVFPHPDGPSRHTISPGAISSDTPRNAISSP
jgi:hypothetical protein